MGEGPWSATEGFFSGRKFGHGRESNRRKLISAPEIAHALTTELRVFPKLQPLDCIQNFNDPCAIFIHAPFLTANSALSRMLYENKKTPSHPLVQCIEICCVHGSVGVGVQVSTVVSSRVKVEAGGPGGVPPAGEAVGSGGAESPD